MCMRHMFRQRTMLVLAIMAALCVGVVLTTDPAVAAEVVVVYTARHYGQEPVFEAFTKQTGIEMQSFDGSPSELFERLQAEGDKTPADVLVSVDAGDLWNAAQAGLLAKIVSSELQDNISAQLRGAEILRVGLSVRERTTMYNNRRFKPEDLSTYEALGDPKWKNRLCLRSSNHIYNQSLLAAMIKRFGEPKVEAIVRGWVANNPTLINSDTRILESIAAGECDVGLTNSYYLGRLLAQEPNLPVAPFWANQQTTRTP